VTGDVYDRLAAVVVLIVACGFVLYLGLLAWLAIGVFW
jgi:hypothetical protein